MKQFFTVPTIRFQVLYVFLVLAHDRRRILHFNVTAHPTAEWTAQQLREAFPFDQLGPKFCGTGGKPTLPIESEIGNKENRLLNIQVRTESVWAWAEDFEPSACLCALLFS